VARVHDRLAREAVEERPNGREERLPVAARQVDATDRPGEQQVAGEEMAGGMERDVAGAVPGNVDDRELDARDGHLVAPADDVLGVVRSDAKAAAGLACLQRL
jgi:hypothetical protein